MLKELQQIEKMLEDRQNAACLAFIEQLEQSKPDCACLACAKLSIHRAEERWEDSLEVAKKFYARESDNPLAASELAMSYAFCNRWSEAISVIIDGIEAWEETSIHSSLLTGLQVIGETALVEGNYIPAIQISQQLLVFDKTVEQGSDLYARAIQADLPLVAKELTFRQDYPDDFPEIEQFQKAANYIISARWKKGLAIMESLTPHADAWPNLWKNIALFRLCLGQTDSAIDALTKYIHNKNVSLEDATDAELLRLCMIPDPLGDCVDILHLTCEINDVDKVQEILLSDKRFKTLSGDLSALRTSDSPPPKLAFSFLDRPLVGPEEELTPENISMLLSEVLLFGKETDRNARLTFTELRSTEKDKLIQFLQELIGPYIITWNEPMILQTFSETFLLLHARFIVDQQHRVKNAETTASGASQEEVEKSPQEQREYFEEIFRNKFVSDWINHPMGLLDGKTPAQAAGDPNYRIPLLGAIQVIDFWMADLPSNEFCDGICARLNLPPFGPIPVPKECSRAFVASPKLDEWEQHDIIPIFLQKIPISRWYRVDIPALSLYDLLWGYRKALLYRESKTLALFAEEILTFPAQEIPPFFRQDSIRQLIIQAQRNHDLERAFQLIEQGKEDAALWKHSDGWINLTEVSLRLMAGDMPNAIEVISHIMENHRREPEIVHQLQQILVSFGLITPDGSSAVRPAPPEPQRSILEPQPPQDASPESASKLWVPD